MEGAGRLFHSFSSAKTSGKARPPREAPQVVLGMMRTTLWERFGAIAVKSSQAKSSQAKKSKLSQFDTLPFSCLLFMYDTQSDAGDISDRSAVSAEIAERRQNTNCTQVTTNERRATRTSGEMSRLSLPVKCQPNSDVEAACALQYTILHLFSAVLTLHSVQFGFRGYSCSVYRHPSTSTWHVRAHSRMS